MTKINKIIMHGFKSFARRTELILGNDFNCILGPNGSGKCVKGESLVQLADGSLVRIDELVNKKLKNNPTKKLDDGHMAYGDNTKIISLNPNSMKSSPKQIQAYIKRKSPKKLLKIITKSGRTITTTKYHPLFTLKNNKIKTAKAEELKQGVRIAAPRNINLKEKSNYFFELIDSIKPKDKIYIPYNDKFKDILLNLKKDDLWEELADKIKIPKNSIKGLLDKQSINFAYLVKILKFANLKNKEIIQLIPKIKGKTSSITYKMPWKNSPEFARFLGYLLAEGKLPPSSSQIWFTNGNDKIIADFKKLVDKLFEVDASVNEYKPNCWDVLFYSEPLRKILIKFGMSLKNTQHKKITNLFLKNSSNKELSELLNGLYSGDGYISNNSIEITTKSKNLALAIENILLRLNIQFTSHFITKIATNSGFSGIYKSINIYGVENFKKFHNHVNLTHPKKNKIIKKSLDIKSNPNLDLIEANSLVKKVTNDLKIPVKSNKKRFPKLDAYCYNQCLTTRNGLNQLIDNLFTQTNSSNNCNSLLQLKTLAKSDIYWDEIIEIKEIPSKEKWVYDLCVKDNHNFIANNFFVHNSNVLDALCFVLGRLSAKSMRVHKASNLIYNGGKTKKAMKQAEVSIFFDNENETFPTEYPYVKITRIIKKSGKSIYKINDKKRTRQEILDLMSVAKIDPEGYNIVLQGDIVRFTEMRPDDRRALIEEISGISIYEEKKQKALRELEKVDEKLKEAEVILAERKRYLKELKKDRDQALKFKELESKVKENKASLIFRRIEKTEEKKSKLDKKINKHKEKLKELNNNIEEIKKEIENKKQNISKINKEIEEKGEKGQVKLQKETEELKVEIATSKTRIDTLRGEIDKIELRKKSLKEDLKNIDNEIKELNSKKQEIEENKNSVKEELEEINDKINNFREKNELEDASKIEKQIEEAEEKAEQKQQKLEDLRKQQQELLRKKDNLEYQLESIDEKINKVLEIEKENKEQIEDLKNKKQEFKDSVLELNKRLNEDSSLSKQISSKKQKLSNAQEEFAKLQAKDAAIRESVLGDMAVKKILEQKNKIKGIYGTVAELGEVEKKYSLALEVAAGPRLKSIVVENDKTAAKCIKFLKKHKLGTATFLPLNKIKTRKIYPEIKKLKDKEDVHDFAVNLVSFDDKFKKIFSYVFGHTLVVEDIDTARKIGIGRSRMVTLDGDLAETSGAMQGGFRQKKRYSFNRKELQRDLKEYEELLSKLRKTISTLEKRRKENEETISKLREKKANLEGDIIKQEKSLHLESGDIESDKNRKKELQEKLEQKEQEINNIELKIDEKIKSLTDIKTKKQQLRSKISELRNPEVIAELSAYEEKAGELKEKIMQYSADIKSINTQINDMKQPEKEKINSILSQQSKESQKFKQEIEKLTKKNQEDNQTLKEHEKKSQEFYIKFKQLFNQRDKLNDKIQEQENNIENIREKSKNVEIEMNNVSLKNAEVKAKLSGLEEDFKEYEGVKINKEKPVDQLKQEIEKFEKIVSDIGNVNMRSLEVYEEIEKEYQSLLNKKEKLSLERKDVVEMMDEIEGKKKDLFMKTFNALSENFKRIFSAITPKDRNADLVLENPENPFEAGLDIKVKITGKKTLDIRSLSGGEKTLTALAFIFAIQEHEPHSFYVLDEVDAALDKHNSEKLAKLIRDYVKKAQYLIISHNDAIISEADNLYGVSMNEHGITNVTSLEV